MGAFSLTTLGIASVVGAGIFVTTATVAVGWAGYAVSFLDSLGIHVPHDLASPPFGSGSGIVNLPAVLVVAGTTALLVVGTRQSATVNNAIVPLKLVVLVLFVAVGAFAVDSSNWTPFVPANEGDFGGFGSSGIIPGAGVVFFC